MTHTICENLRVTFEDGLVWKMTLMATPCVGTWNIKATLTRNGRVNSRRIPYLRERHGRWSARTGWDPTKWRPLPGSEIAQIAEEWMQAHPVPISDGVAVSRGRP
jgi:hypothetical protein